MKKCMSEISKNTSDKQIPESIQQEEIPRKLLHELRK